MNPLLLVPLSDLVSKLFDKVWPDPAAKAQAQLELIRMQQTGELESMKIQMSAILAEASSSDPWTSRARPSFMYVIYILLLAGIPMGVLSAFHPAIATQVATGFNQWLTAIPDALYTLFGAGYLGYAGARSIEKVKGVTK
jgi:hypothetical protein